MLKRLVGNHRGVSIVEFALVLPLLLAFLGATIDFGLAFFVSHIAQNAAREGARLAVTKELTPGVFSDPEVNQRVEGLLPSIALFQDFTHTDTFDRAACQVTVTVNGQSPYFFVPAFLAARASSNPSLEGQIAIERSVTMRYEGDCSP